MNSKLPKYLLRSDDLTAFSINDDMETYSVDKADTFQYSADLWNKRVENK